MAISATLHTQKNLETHQNRLSRFFQQHSQPGQPAQAAPSGEYHTGLARFPLADGAFVHIQPVSQLDVRQGISDRTCRTSAFSGLVHSSPGSRVWALKSPIATSCCRQLICSGVRAITLSPRYSPANGMFRKIISIMMFVL